MSRNIMFAKRVTIALLIIIGGWSIYTLIRLSLEILLKNIGVESELAQAGILVVIVITTLTILGYSFRKSLKKLGLY